MTSCGPPLTIKQGTSRVIAVTGIRDREGLILDPTGWEIHAVARSGIWGPVVAVWRDDPTPGDLLAQVVPADSLIDSTVEPGEKWIYLYIEPGDSDTWIWGDAVLDVEIHEPFTGREETFSTDLKLVPTTVRS